MEDARKDLSEAAFEEKGYLTEVGLKCLREYLSEVPADRVHLPMRMADTPRLFTCPSRKPKPPNPRVIPAPDVRTPPARSGDAIHTRPVSARASPSPTLSHIRRDHRAYAQANAPAFDLCPVVEAFSI